MANGDIAALCGGKPVDTSEQNRSKDFDPIPPDWYRVAVKKSELEKTKNGKGVMLVVAFAVTGEHYNGRMIFHRFNLVNESAKATEIGHRELGDLGLAVGLTKGVESSEQLLGKECDVKVVIREARGDYPADNEIKNYAPLGTKAGKGQAAPAPRAGQKPAWEKPAEAKVNPEQEARAEAVRQQQQQQAAAPQSSKPRMPWEKK